MAARLVLFLDPVYTGKAMAGLIAHVRAGRIAAGSRVLFIHTGGLPALFAYVDKLGPWPSKAPRRRCAEGGGAAGPVPIRSQRSTLPRPSTSHGTTGPPCCPQDPGIG